MPPFQLRCASKVSQLLRAGGLTSDSKEVEGEDETYLVFEVDLDGAEAPHRVVVYVYEDEAGFFVDEKWHIWERPDHGTLDKLMESFLDGLRSALGLEVSEAEV